MSDIFGTFPIAASTAAPGPSTVTNLPSTPTIPTSSAPTRTASSFSISTSRDPNPHPTFSAFSGSHPTFATGWNNHHSTSLSPGIIVAIVAGVVIGIFILGILAYHCRSGARGLHRRHQYRNGTMQYPRRPGADSGAEMGLLSNSASPATSGIPTLGYNGTSGYTGFGFNSSNNAATNAAAATQSAHFAATAAANQAAVTSSQTPQAPPPSYSAL